MFSFIYWWYDIQTFLMYESDTYILFYINKQYGILYFLGLYGTLYNIFYTFISDTLYYLSNIYS